METEGQMEGRTMCCFPLKYLYQLFSEVTEQRTQLQEFLI